MASNDYWLVFSVLSPAYSSNTVKLELEHVFERLKICMCTLTTTWLADKELSFNEEEENEEEEEEEDPGADG